VTVEQLAYDSGNLPIHLTDSKLRKELRPSLQISCLRLIEGHRFVDATLRHMRSSTLSFLRDPNLPA
jgi:hypothetical protein